MALVDRNKLIRARNMLQEVCGMRPTIDEIIELAKCLALADEEPEPDDGDFWKD